jgi:hypothetical protein
LTLLLANTAATKDLCDRCIATFESFLSCARLRQSKKDLLNTK